MTIYTCPARDPEDTDIPGCGRTFDVSDADRDDDPDRWVDCPHCGLGFDPDYPGNRSDS
jgi:hypothetical protein